MAKRRSPEETEDIILRKIYLVTLKDAPMENRGHVYLTMTAAELLSEGKDLRLCRDRLEQIVFDRLSGDFMDAVPPFKYLVESYRRACEEEKKISNIKDQSLRSQMELAVKQAKNLAVSYCRTHLANPGMFPDSDARKTSTPLLLSLILSTVWAPGDPGAGNKTTHGFIEELLKEGDYESMKPIYKLAYEGLRDSVFKVSASGNFQQHLSALMMLIKSPVGAKVLVELLDGSNLNGRGLETETILGAFFHVSALPDHASTAASDVGREFFSGSSSADVVSSDNIVRNLMSQLHQGLTDVIKLLLKNDTREGTLRYLADVINKNASRAQMQVDPLSCASSGMFANLSAVMLRLCDPFAKDSTKWDKIDASYVYNSKRLDLGGLTCINTTSEQVSELARARSNNQKSFSFICECFFMTARVLNLGLIKSLAHWSQLIKDIQSKKDVLFSLKEIQDSSPSPQMEQDIAIMEKKIEALELEQMCYNAQIVTNKDLFQRALQFYKMMLTWMVNLAAEEFQVPLPSACPTQFAVIPEHFVDDALELLIYASQLPDRFGMLDGVSLEGFLDFMLMFMGSPGFIRNPYLRAKMVQVLNCWMPYKGKSPNSPPPRNEALFQMHKPAVDHLVRNLLQIYVDIEFTGNVASQFFDKFNTRHCVSQLLKYLWEVLDHRLAWIRIAKDEKRGLYIKFLNFLLNDSIYLLDESLKKIIQSKESGTSDEVHEEEIINMEMTLANEDVNMLSFTSEYIVGPFLLPEMVERVASMLNYFLSQLVGPQRRSLAVTDPERYGFRPKELVHQIVTIYVNLARRDPANVFAVAISKDGRSYNEKLFDDAAAVLRKIGEDPRTIHEFSELGRKVSIASEKTREAESAWGEIPEEFLDPLMNEVMTDPVILPVSRVTIDRPVILRHLLSKSTDPFTADVHLTADMLVPDTELKAKIDSFLRSQTPS